MRKLFICIILILILLVTGSCSLVGSRTDMLNSSNNEETAKARMEAIYEVLKSQDKEGLKAMFSEQALSDSDDFDDNLDNIFGFFQGKFESWEKIPGLGVEESNDYGHITRKVRTYFYIKTDKQKYYIYLEDFPVDTDHPDNVGIYLLLVVKVEDEDRITDGEEKIIYDGKTRIPRAGIYLPFE